MQPRDLDERSAQPTEQCHEPQRKWWPMDALPEPIVQYTRVALEAISRGTFYVPMGWS
ncbi:hypothetical protein AB0D14_37560 [Streptomyces sp. NPDC048484]|uniref:hypothetical protein n=1 Tax=Streptomyces sp. NPDC048484 TaxID=3155146 RepID=UPI00343540BE